MPSFWASVAFLARVRKMSRSRSMQRQAAEAQRYLVMDTTKEALTSARLHFRPD